MDIKKLLKTLLEEAEFYEEEASDHGTAIACRAAIAAVETLRGQLERCKDEYVEAVHPEFGTAWRDEWYRAEAAEERVAELAGALAHLLEFADSTGQGCAKQVENARAVLASTPAEALARAKGEDYAAGLEAAAKWHDDLVTFMEDGPPDDSTEAAAKRHRKCAKAIRALGKEEAVK